MSIVPFFDRHPIRLFRFALVGLFVTLVSFVSGSTIDLRFVHSHDAKYSREAVHPVWTVDVRDGGERGSLRPVDAGTVHGGYVLMGSPVVVPEDVVDARVALAYRMSFVENDWRNVSGHLGLAIMTEAAWQRLAGDPKAASVMNFYRNRDWIYHVKLNGYNTSAEEYRQIESPDFSSVLENYRGQKLYFALIWGTVEPGTEWLEFKDFSLTFKNEDERQMAFLQSFRDDLPALEPMQQALAVGDATLAKARLLDYFRKRSEPSYLDDADFHTPQAMEHARQALGGKFFAQASHVPPVAVDRGVMWSATPEDQEQWAVAINRHHLWAWLASAYRQTNERAFLEEVETQILDWSQSMPVEFGRFFTEGLFDSFGKLPLTLNAGIRMGNTWFAVFEMLRRDLSDDALFTLLYWMREHGRYLAEPVHFGPESNWGAMQNNGLFHVAVMLPELRAARHWQSTAEERMLLALSRQVYPDGVQMELTPTYHRITAALFASSIRLARLNRIPVNEEVDALINRMYRVVAGIMMPDMRTPDVNDSIRVSARDLSVAVELFPDDDFFPFFASERAEGNAPEFTSISYPWAGWRVMRENWSADGIYLFFETGPLGVTHYHEDKLGFHLFGHGQHLLREFGFYPYDQSEWSHHSRTARAHNTILINGAGQNRSASHPKYLKVESPDENGQWFSDADFDYASGEYTNGLFTDVDGNNYRMTHRREIIYLKPDVFIVLDTLIPPDDTPYTAEVLFHLSRGITEVDQSRGIVSSQVGNARLQIVPLTEVDGVRIVEGQREPYLLGWERTRTIGELNPRPVAVFENKASGMQQLMWLLLPESTAVSPANVVLSRESYRDQAHLQIALGGERRIWLARGADGEGIRLRADNINERGRIKVVNICAEGTVEVSD